MKNKIVKVPRIMEIIMKIFISLSIPCVTLLISPTGYGYLVVCINLLLSFFIGIVITKKIDMSKIKKSEIFASIFIGLYAGKYILQYGSETLNGFLENIIKIINIPILQNILARLMYFAIVPALLFYAYLFVKYLWPVILSFFKSLADGEKKYLKIVFCFGFVIILLLAVSTNAFYRPAYNGYIVDYDVMYTTDTGTLTYNDVYTNVAMVENDIRQPLFGVMAFPFGLIAHFFSQFLFFIPVYTYELLMVFIQIILLAITIIMLARILKVREKDKKYFYLLFSLSFPYLLFSIVLEQYVIGLFYLILVFYCYFNSKKINYAYIGATGTLLTSGIIFPLISKSKDLKQWVKDVAWCAVIFFVVMSLSGQLVQVPFFREALSNLSTFNGKITFSEKLYQFTNFVKGIFVATPGEVVFSEGIPRYFLREFTSYNIIGILILLATFVGFILNRKDKMSLIAFLWVIFSFIILVVVGWGTAENGLILYSLYFAWAYIILIYKLLKSLIKNEKYFHMIILLIVFITLLLNVKEFYNIIKFALEYYRMF